MVYGLREALRIVLEEGLDPRIARHRGAGEAMAAGLAALGLDLFGQPSGSLKMPMLAPVLVPEGVDDRAFRARLLETHGIEIMGAFGPLAGRIWRIGTMAGNAQPGPVARSLAALAETLGDRARGRLGDALGAASRRFDALTAAPASA
jgi:(S)-ureidoglycine-glyoxylate aminotransferase